jgi:hypothetical protein
LVIDLYPSKPASATAINNLIRCTLGCIGVGFIEETVGAVEEVFIFLGLAGLCTLSLILVWVARTYGPGWRMERLKRIKMQQLEQQFCP